MSEKTIPFVVNDRRKFTAAGDVREGVDLTPAPEPVAVAPAVHEDAGKVVAMPPPAEGSEGAMYDNGWERVNAEDAPEYADRLDDYEDALAHEGEEMPASGSDATGEEGEALPPAPTQEQMEQSKRAFDATAERLDLAIRSANPGADHAPLLTFESLVQSVYMQAVMQLGGGGAQAGEQPQIDLLGARQSIDMLGVLLEKTVGHLTANENLLLASAVFELRLAFLEMTQALARSAQQRGPAGPLGGPGSPAGPGAPGGRPGPSIVR